MHEVNLELNLERLIRVPNARDDKYSRGVVGFVTGSNEYPGAALLGVSAALNCSIGMVRYVGETRVQDLILGTRPEVVCRESFAQAGRANAWVLGSGISATDQSQVSNLLSALASETRIFAVVDAGALDVIDFEEVKHHSLILTPHAGELARLLNRLENTDEYHAEMITEGNLLFGAKAAKQTGQTVLLKGSKTVIIKPSGEGRVVGPNSVLLATAGSGDVLAGILGAIAAANSSDNKFEWLDVAELAIKLHSAAAELASESQTVNSSAIVQYLAEIWGSLLK